MDQVIHLDLKLKDDTPFLYQLPEREMIDWIFATVKYYSGISEELMMSRTRQEPVVIARHMVMYFLWYRTGISCAEIGSLFRRDHASVLYGRDNIQSKLDTRYGPVRKLYENVNCILSRFQTPTGHVTERREFSR